MSKSQLSRSVWESFISRFSGSRKLSRQRRRSLNRHWNNGVAAESLEQRIVPVVTVAFSAGTLTLTGEAANNEAVTVVAGSAFTDIKVNGVFTARVNQATSNSISTINFTGGASAADTLSISGTNQAITVNLTDVETLSLTSTRDAVVKTNEPLILGTSTVSGTLSVTTNAGTPAATTNNTGNITQSGKLIVSGLTTLDANSVAAFPVVVNNGGDITLSNSGNSFGTLELSGTAISITEAGATDLGTTTALGALTVNSRGAITDSGVLAVTGTATLTSVGNAITLDDPTSTFGTFVLSGTDVAVTDNSAVVLGKTTATGTLSVTSKAGGASVTQTGSIKVGGLATITTTTNGAVDLDEATPIVNNFGSISVSAGSGTVEIREKSATNLAGVTAGVLSVTSNGAITDSDVIAVSTGPTTLTTTGGAITLDEDTSTFAGAFVLTGTNIAITDASASELGASTATGTLSLTSGGNVTESGVLKVTGRLTVSTSGTVSLSTTAGHNFGSISVVGPTSAGAGNTTITEASASDLFTSNITGTLALTSGGAVTDSGDVTVTGTTGITAPATKNITLDSAGNEFGGAITTTGKRIVLNNTLATVLGTTTANGVGSAGSLTVTSGGAVTQSGAGLTVPGRATITATGNNITLTTAANAFGSVAVDGAIVQVTESGATDLFSVNATDDFTLISTGAVTDSGTVTVGDITSLTATGQDITLDSAASTFGGNVLLAGANVSFKDSDAGGVNLNTSTVTGNLTINAGGDITDEGSAAATVKIGVAASAVNVTATFNAGSGGNITLDATGFLNAAGAGLNTLSLTGEDAVVSLFVATVVDLGTTTLTGLLNLTTTGAVTDSGNVVVAGTTTIAAGAANNITLNSSANSFVGTIVITSGLAVTLNNTSATDIGASTIAGSLTVTSSGAITDSGVITVGTTTSLAATGSAITFDSTISTFAGALTLSGSDVSLIDNDSAVVLTTVTATGAFSLNKNNAASAGDITQTGAISVGGLATINNADGDIVLTGTNNSFGSIGATATTAAAAADVGDISITEKNATTLAATASTDGGVLTVISVGAITDSGTITTAGAASFNANSNNADITLDSAASTFGSLTLKGVNIAVTEAAATDLLLVIANNTFSLTSTGAITDSGDVTVAGAATITSTGTGANGVITLGGGEATNFGSVGLTGSQATVQEDSSTNLAASSITISGGSNGNLSLTSSGAVTDSGSVAVAGTTTISCAGFDITLDSAANSFTGSLFFTAKHVAATNDRATKLGDSTATGTFTIVSNGSVTEDDGTVGQANLTITGTFTIDASAGAFDITIVATAGVHVDTFSTLPLLLIVGVGGMVNYTP